MEEWVPSYTAVTVFYDPCIIRYAALCRLLADIKPDGDVNAAPRGRRLVVPVLYGGEAGPDLPAVAALLRMEPPEVIRRHATPVYRVVMIGFAPGFPYLAGLDPALAAPRLERPRGHVPAGSVGLGGEQTGVYTLATPGGWRIIGRTPVRLFEARRRPAALLAPGDEVRFRPIGADAYRELERAVATALWRPELEDPP